MDTMIRRRMMIMEVGGSPTPPEPPAPPVFYDKLIFDGTAYIITDIIPPVDFSVAAWGGDESIKAAQRFMMCTDTNGVTGFIMGGQTTSTRRSWNVYRGSSTAVLAGRLLNFSNYQTYSIIFTPRLFGFGNSTSSYTKGSGVPNGFLHIGQNPTLTGQPYSGYMATTYIYDSTAQNATSVNELLTFTPIYTLKPCLYNGAAGLWNDEEGKFYGNSAGTGTLTVLNNS